MKIDELLALCEAYEKAYEAFEKAAANFSWQTLANNGMRVAAIKSFRDLNGCSLKVAKDSVDAYILLLSDDVEF